VRRYRQWLRHGVKTREGRKGQRPILNAAIAGQLEQQRHELGAASFDAGRFDLAGQLFQDMVTRENSLSF